MTRKSLIICFLIPTLCIGVLQAVCDSTRWINFTSLQPVIASEIYNKTLKSPNYPSYYPANQYCGWRIKAPYSWSFVRLYVLEIDMETSENCSYDSLSFYDGDSPSDSKLLAKFCGHHQRLYVLNYGLDVLIKFKSDSAIRGKGFRLQFSSAVRFSVPVISFPTPQFRCGREEEADYSRERNLTTDIDHPGQLTSPNYPLRSSEHQYCGWKIKAARGYVVRVWVVDLRITYSFNNDCSLGGLSLFDSDTAVDSLLLVKICGDKYNWNSYYSSGRYMYVHFETKTLMALHGFKLLYSAVKPRTSMTTDMPYVSSYLYAQTYFRYLRSLHYSKENRFWTIRSEPGYAVQLYVEDMDLQNSSICTYNAVTVLNSDYTIMAKMCNYQFNGVTLYSTRGQVMFVRFTTGTRATGKGFSLRYRAVSSWPAYSGYTTQVPSTTTSASDSRSSGSKLTVISIVIGIVAFCLVLLPVVYCIRKRSIQTQRPHVEHRSTVTFRSGPTPASANAGVYTVPTSQPTAPVDGFTNLAYTAEPPAYSSLQHSPPVVPAAPVPSSPEPPAYTEAMKLVYPPSYDGVNDDASTQPISESSPLPRDAATPASPITPSPHPEEPTPGSGSVTTVNE